MAKRAQKNINRETAIVEDSSSTGLWCAWLWSAAWNRLEPRNSNLFNEFGELEWVYQQLRMVIDVVEVECDSRIVGSLASSEVINRPPERRPKTRPSIPTNDPSMILLASASRSDPIEEALIELSNRFPDAKLRLVLGEWWDGHRRTWPLPLNAARVYWHQCHDVLLPDAIELQRRSREPATQVRPALVISGDSSIRQMWLEVLPTLGFQPLAARDATNLPEGVIDLVILDQYPPAVRSPNGVRYPSPEASQMRDECDPVSTQLSILRNTYPQAKMVVCSGFPRWDEVRRYLDAGATILLGKPFQTEGFGRLLDASFSSAALPRR